jgi:hypothetical protein
MEIVECTFTIPFFSTFIVGMDGFTNPHKIVVRNNAFPTFALQEMKVFQK